MLFEVFQSFLPAAISITINATVRTSIIFSNVLAINAQAMRPLAFVFEPGTGFVWKKRAVA